MRKAEKDRLGQTSTNKLYLTVSVHKAKGDRENTVVRLKPCVNNLIHPLI